MKITIDAFASPDDTLPNKEGPVTRYLSRAFPRRVEEGLRAPAWRAQSVQIWIFQAMWATKTEDGFMNIIEELTKNYDQAASLWGLYKNRLDAFRGAVKNDVSSLEASARKTTASIERMNEAYGRVITQMTGHEMAKAVENAERLATAMRALAELQEQRFVLSVVDEKPKALHAE